MHLGWNSFWALHVEATMVATKGCQNVNYFQWFLDFLCVPHLRLYCYFDYSAPPCAIIHVSHVQEGLAGRKLICCQHGNFWYDAERLSFKAVDWEMSNLYTGTQGASFRHSVHKINGESSHL